MIKIEKDGEQFIIKLIEMEPDPVTMFLGHHSIEGIEQILSRKQSELKLWQSIKSMCEEMIDE